MEVHVTGELEAKLARSAALMAAAPTSWWRMPLRATSRRKPASWRL